MQENEVSLFLYHRMTVQFSHYPFLEPANPSVGQSVRSRAESRSPGLGVRTSKAGCALEAWAAPCSLAVATTPYSACSSVPVTAGGLTPPPLTQSSGRPSSTPAAQGLGGSPGPAVRLHLPAGGHRAPSHQRLSRHLRTSNPRPASRADAVSLAAETNRRRRWPQGANRQRGSSSPPIPQPQTLVAGGCLLFYSGCLEQIARGLQGPFCGLTFV